MIPSIIGVCITTLLAYLVGRKKGKADITKTEAETDRIEVDTDRIFIKNLTTAINIYKNISADVQKDMIILRSELEKMRKENNELKTQMEALQTELHLVRKENAALKQKLIQLDKTLNNK